MRPEAQAAPGPGRSGLPASIARAAQLVAPALLPIAVAIGALPLTNQGQIWPWQPNTVDLHVYQFTGEVLLDGGDILTAVTPDSELAFIYPAFAALLCVPLTVVPYTLLQLLWTSGMVAALTAVMHRLGLRGWNLALAATVVVLVVEPVRATIGFGQINLFVLAMVCFDVLPSARRRLLPRGVLTGLAAAVKVTPALFIVYFALNRQWREFWASLITLLSTTALAWIILPRESLGYWQLVFGGNTRTGAAHFLMNQSALAVVTRVAGTSDTDKLFGLALGAIVALGCLIAAVWWARCGSVVFAMGLVGVATLIASPLSWSHHFVWVVPLGATVLADRAAPWWVRGVVACFVVWVSVAVFKVALPWGDDVELTYDLPQLVISSIGPVLMLMVTLLALGAGWRRRTVVPEAERESPRLRTEAEVAQEPAAPTGSAGSAEPTTTTVPSEPARSGEDGEVDDAGRVEMPPSYPQAR